MTQGTERAVPPIYLAHNGQSRCWMEGRADHYGAEAANELRQAFRRASGIEIGNAAPGKEEEAADASSVQILFLTREELLRYDEAAKPLAEEEYRILYREDRLIFAADADLTLLYAVSDFLDRHMGVRWLWPGELGTFVPKRESIAIPPIDATARPALEHRRLRSAKDSPEVRRWNAMQRMGNRSVFKFGHAFLHWWPKYGEAHPEYFAMPPEGEQQVEEDRIKLDLSNPHVEEVIINEWREAGYPDNWNVSPNDGIGFCVSAGCLAMDEPPFPDVREVWQGNVNLTPRYVKFWNRLIGRMRIINPNVTLSTYAYSCYREPPKPPMRLEDGMVIGIVHSWQAYEQWLGWHEAGAKLYLRPNWWHYGAMAPHLMLHATGAYFKFAGENGMLGFDFDSIMGHWGTQGLNYYLIARLSVRPDMTVDDVIAEYCSAFGAASSVIREYFRYWETFSEEAAYNVIARKAIPGSVPGKFEQLVERFDLPGTPTSAGWTILPYLLTDDVLHLAQALLDRADQAVAARVSAGGDEGEAEVIGRIQFLRDGLRHLELTRDVVRYGYEKSRPAGATLEQFVRLRIDLDGLREELDAKQVIWKDFNDIQEQRRNIPTHESRTKGWEPSERSDSTELSGRKVDATNLGLF